MKGIVICVLAVLLAAGCDGRVESIGAGKHTVGPAYYGLWTAKSAERGCTYSLISPKGITIWSKSWSPKNPRPTVQLGTGNKGYTFTANGKCGFWT